MVNWAAVYNRLFELIDRKGDSYFSGSRFIRKVQEVDPYHPDYTDYVKERSASLKSTTRKYYYKDILWELDEPRRMRVVNSILDETSNRPRSRF